MIIFSKIFIWLAYLICPFYLEAMDIGSDTAVTRFNTQQILDDGDRIAGFAGLNAGFELFNSSVTGIFDSFFSVSGDIQLNGGTLNLTQDLILANVGNFVSLGNINGTERAIYLSPTMTTIPSGGIIDCNISFLTESADLDTNVFTIDWSFDDKFIAVGLDNGGGDDLRILSFDGSTLVEVASAALQDVEINSVAWHPSKYCLAVAQDTEPVFGELLIFEFDGVNTLSLRDTDTVGANGDGVAWHPTGDFLAFSNDANANEIFIYPVNSDCTLDKAGAVSADLAPNKNPDFDSINWRQDGDYLYIGTRAGGGGSELYAFEVTTAPLSITQNANLDTGRLRGVSANPLAFLQDRIVTVGNTSPQLRLYQHLPTVPAGGDPGSFSLLSSIVLGVPGRGVDWAPTGGCIAVGTNVNGAAGEFFTYQFDPRVDTLTQVDEFELGTVTRAIKWARSGDYVANGNNNDVVQVYSQDAAFQEYIFSNLRLFLNSNVTLRDCGITFTGENILHGQGNCLTLLPTCTLKVGENAGLLIQDIRILGMKEGSLQMLDNTSTISFKDVTLVFDEDYTFTQGRFDVLRRLTLEGEEKTFCYTSDQVSMISDRGIFEIGPEVTFRYDPSIASKSLISLAAASSTMILHSATLSTSSTGIQLTQGNLIIDGKVAFFNEGMVAAEGIEWGDGLSSTNNLSVEWEPAAVLGVTGQFVNNNLPC